MVSNSLGGIYKFGTISVTSGDTTFTGTSTLWSTVAEQGDWILADGQVAVITADIADTELVSEIPWTGSTLVNAEYVLLKMSWLRYEPAILQQKVRELLASLAASGQFTFVDGAAPNDADGDDGDWAFKVNDGSWRLWYKVGGVWVLQGIPVGIDLAGAYNPATDYLIGKVVTFQGKLWRGLVTPNVGHQPDTSPTQWSLVLSGGDRYDIAFFDTDRPASGELIGKLMPVDVSFMSGLSQSAANAEVGATVTSVYSFKKNGVEFATLTFAGGGQGGTQNGVFVCATTTSFGISDILTIWAPATKDVTLSGVGGNLIGYR